MLRYIHFAISWARNRYNVGFNGVALEYINATISPRMLRGKKGTQKFKKNTKMSLTPKAQECNTSHY